MLQVSWLMISFWTRQIKYEIKNTGNLWNYSLAYTDLCIDVILTFCMGWTCMWHLFWLQFMVLSYYLYIFKVIQINKTAIPAVLKMLAELNTISGNFFLWYLKVVLHYAVLLQVYLYINQWIIYIRRTEKYVHFKILSELWVLLFSSSKHTA